MEKPNYVLLAIVALFFLKDLGCIWFSETVADYAVCVSQTYDALYMGLSNNK